MAGLFDSLSNGGGLLDFLRNLNQQNSFSGLPSDIAQYGQQPMAAMAQMQPPQQMQAPAAQPMQQQPMQPQQQGPDFGSRLMAGIQGFSNENPGGLIQHLANGIGSFSAGRRVDPIGATEHAANQTAQYLVAKHGFDPAMAQAVVSDPATLRSILPSLMGVGGQTDDIKEYQFAKKEDPSLTFASFMQKKRAVTGEYSLNPTYGTNEKGETVLMQTGKSGEAIQTKLPPGVKVAAGVDKVDLGTHWGILDKRTGTVTATIPKDIEGKEAAEERGKAKGLAQVSLPTVLAKSTQALGLIDAMIKHPGRETATGSSSQLDPRNYMAGTDARDFQVRSKQLEGRAFLEAYEQLRGTGSISENEGEKATAAIARLDKSQSDKEYLTALNDLRAILVTGMENARIKAGQPPSAPAAASAAPEISRADAEAELRRRGKIK